MADVVLVCDPRAEANVVAALVSLPACRAVVMDRLAEGDFHAPDCRWAFRAIHRAWARGTDLDSDACQDWLGANERFVAAQAVADGTPWPDAVARVRDAAIRRHAQRTALRVLDLAADGGADGADAASALRELAGTVDDRGAKVPATTAELCDDAIGRLELPPTACQAIPWTGFPALDVAALEPGTVFVVGCRPRVGKTSFVLSAGLAQASVGISVGIVCIEMTPDQLISRCVCQLSGLGYRDVRHPSRMDTAGRDAYRRALGRLRAMPIHFEGGKSMTVSAIARTARHWKSKHGLQVLGIDYVQNVRHEGRGEMRERVTATCEAVKALSQDLSLPVIELAQLNRDAEDAVPRLENLKEAGAIEEWADAILLLDRPDAHQPEPARRNYMDAHGSRIDMRGRAAGLLVKNRNGPEGCFFFDFDGQAMAFRRADLRQAVDAETEHWATRGAADDF